MGEDNIEKKRKMRKVNYELTWELVQEICSHNWHTDPDGVS